MIPVLTVTIHMGHTLVSPVTYPQNTPTAHLQRGKTPSLRVSCYDTKQSDGEAPVMLELWGIQCTPSLLSLPGPYRSRVVAPDRILSMGQIELNYVLMLN